MQRRVEGCERGDAALFRGVSRCPFSPPASPSADAPPDEFAFLLEHGEVDKLPDAQRRVEELRAQVAAGGAASLREEELARACRVGWRNHARCIGRLYWRSLQVRDRRAVGGADAVIDELVEHLRIATNGGNIRPTMTVFAPAERGRAVRIWNQQLCSYAGYREKSGRILGDPRTVEFTSRAMALGWQPPRPKSAFDLLPLVVTGLDGSVAWRELPRDAVKEVHLAHPDHDWFEEFGWRWYATPVVSDFRFRVAGTNFPAAPFNGWYMGTEIGARNLADVDRYNVLPVLAARLGLDVSDSRTLWVDRALVELNRAVLHSFAQAGVRIVDHHTAAEEFMQFCARESRAGRSVSARWDWIVPPLSSAATPVFHLPMRERASAPDFHAQPAAWLSQEAGGSKM